MTPEPTTMDPIEEDAPGTSVTLTEEGWQSVDYMEPGDDWTPLEDGSYESPDGTMRTWPLSNPSGR